MIATPQFCQTMARYNIWQNQQIADVVMKMPRKELEKPRGAFFGSIFETLNHLLWGDSIWMSRFAQLDAPGVGAAESVSMTPTIAVWSAERFQLDRQILHWAEGLKSIQLNGDMTWYSGATGKSQTKPLGLLVAHMFNHQTHHRGQVHAMLTHAGETAPVSDLFIMPDEIG